MEFGVFLMHVTGQMVLSVSFASPRLQLVGVGKNTFNTLLQRQGKSAGLTSLERFEPRQAGTKSQSALNGR
jgi:hypothetical protein